MLRYSRTPDACFLADSIRASQTVNTQEPPCGVAKSCIAAKTSKVQHLSIHDTDPSDAVSAGATAVSELSANIARRKLSTRVSSPRRLATIAENSLLGANRQALRPPGSAPTSSLRT
eukprot:3060580-Rhodomonas_salina.1